MSKRLRILAGPNGSGKSSVYEALVQDKGFRWGVFVNADEIEKKLREEQRSRYERSLSNLHEAILLSDRAYIFDNSESSHKWIAEYDGVTGELTYKEDEIPQWVEQYV